MEVNASGRPQILEMKIETTSPMFDDIRYLMKAFIFI